MGKVLRFPTPADLNELSFSRSDNIRAIVPIADIWPPRDYADNRVDPYAGLEEQERRARVEADVRRDIRIMRWQARVKWGCLLLAYAAIFYFAVQMGRGR
jgi:hypothetical protein